MVFTTIDSSLIPSSFQNSNNIVLNGGFESWSYGTTFPINQTLFNTGGALTTSYICADFWQMAPAMPPFTNGLFSFVQNSTTQETGAFALDLVVSSVGTTTQMYIQQFVPNPSLYRGKTVTVTARVKCNTVGKIVIRVTDSSGNTDSALNVSTGVYETLTVTKTLASNTTVFTIAIGNISQAIVVGTTTIDSVMCTLGSFSQSYVPSDTGIDKIKAFNPYSTATNIMENGGLEIWQRGTTFTNPTSGTYTADRWQFSSNGVPALTISKETTITDNSPSSLKWNLTSVGTGTVFNLLYKFEASQYVGQTVSLKGRIRVDSGGGGFVQMNFSDAAGTSASVGTLQSTGVWETISLSRVVGAGTSTMTINMNINNVAGVAYFDNFMLVVGNQPVDYVPMNPQVELARCQRYYEAATQMEWFFYDGVGSTNYGINIHFAVPKRTIPTVTVSGGSTNHVASVNANGQAVDGFNYNCITQAGAAKVTIGNGGSGDASWTASADL